MLGQCGCLSIDWVVSWTCGGMVVLWLVCLTSDRAVWVWTLARDNCVVFLGKTLQSHSASLHLGVQMGTSEFNAGGNLQWTCIPSRGGGLEIFLVTSWYWNQDKLGAWSAAWLVHSFWLIIGKQCVQNVKLHIPLHTCPHAYACMNW